MRADRLDLTYILPLKWAGDQGLDELADYLRSIASQCRVVVVDGSEPRWFAEHARVLAERADGVQQLPVDPQFACANGKVAGVLTGVAAATTSFVVVADDDVRYRPTQLAELVEQLADVELVRPINVFHPLPWHARWDSARSLLNLALASDYPGTLAFRRASLVEAGGYDGDVLFENLELIRTLRAHGARERTRQVPIVRRCPPTAGHFWRQRIRQAYDSWAQPLRLGAELAILPSLVLLRRRWMFVAAGGVLVAALGRLRVRSEVPADVPLWTPLWLLERGICSWLALGYRLRGGVPYAGRRLSLAAHPSRILRRTGLQSLGVVTYGGSGPAALHPAARGVSRWSASIRVGGG